MGIWRITVLLAMGRHCAGMLSAVNKVIPSTRVTWMSFMKSLASFLIWRQTESKADPDFEPCSCSKVSGRGVPGRVTP